MNMTYKAIIFKLSIKKIYCLHCLLLFKTFFRSFLFEATLKKSGILQFFIFFFLDLMIPTRNGEFEFLHILSVLSFQK
jgi:hypothetical protein